MQTCKHYAIHLFAPLICHPTCDLYGSEDSDMIGCSGRRVPPEDAELDLVGPGLEEVEGDLGPVHHRDLPLVDHQDVVPRPEAALPRGAGLHHAAKWGLEVTGCESWSPSEHQHQAVVQGEAVAQVHPPGLADGRSPQPDVVSNLVINVL